MLLVKTPKDVPSGKHYAVIEFRKITESSGWGSENDAQVLCPHYYVTTDLDDWTKHIKQLEIRPKEAYYYFVEYVAFQVEGKATVQSAITIH